MCQSNIIFLSLQRASDNISQDFNFEKNLEPYCVTIDITKEKIFNLIKKESDNKVKATHKLIEACFDLLKTLDDKLKSEKALLEDFCMYKIEEESKKVSKKIGNKTGNYNK